MGYYGIDQNSDELEHHGVLGQKWGIRRYQNKDGSLTAEGRKRVYAQGANYGGYESFRHRHRRAIDAAKYEKDIAKNQKKLDRAYEKGNDKKIAKYTEVDRMLKNNRDIMVKDLSPEAIQMGRDYITQMKAGVIGTIIAGPVGGAAAGLGVRYANKMQETEKKVYAQEAERKKMFDEAQNLRKEAKDYDKKKMEDWSESESDKKWDAYYNKDFEAKQNLEKKKAEYNEKQNGNSKTEKFIRENAKEPVWAPDELEFDTKGDYKKKDNIHVNMNVGLDHENEESMIKAATKLTDHISDKENVSKIKDAVVNNMMNDKWEKGDATKEELKKNLNVYGMRLAMTKGDNVYGEINCEHNNYDSKAAPYGDHSIDVEFSYNTKTGKMEFEKYNSING